MCPILLPNMSFHASNAWELRAVEAWSTMCQMTKNSTVQCRPINGFGPLKKIYKWEETIVGSFQSKYELPHVQCVGVTCGGRLSENA
jgi:hypothetical protein